MLITKDKHVPIKGSWKLLGWGLILISLGIIIFVVQPSFVYRTTKMTLNENGESLILWLKPTVEVFAKFYLFNITNKDAFLSGQQKLRVKDVGPYTYRLRFDYEEKSFNPDEGTVTVHPEYFFDWDPALNSGSENDTLVLPNVALLMIASRASSQPFVLKMALNEVIKGTHSEPIVEQTVKEFMRGGDNPLVKLASTLFSFWVNFDSIGYLDRITDSKGDLLTVFTGQKNFQQAGLIANFNDEVTLSHLETPCNRLKGVSDGKKFGNNIKLNETFHVYHKSLCRTLPLVPAGPPTYSDQWLPSVPYTFPDDMFDNGEKNPENKCYCVDGNCLPSGLADVANCYLGFPGAISFPHFLNGHPSLFEKIDGIKPDKSRHTSRLLLNRETGIATNAHVRLQSNIVIRDVSDLYGCEKFSNMVLPLSWINAEFPKLETTIALRMFLALRFFPVVEKILSIICVLAGIYCVQKTVQKSKPRNKHQCTLSVAVQLEDENRNRYKNGDIKPDLRTLLNERVKGAERV